MQIELRNLLLFFNENSIVLPSIATYRKIYMTYIPNYANIRTIPV